MILDGIKRLFVPDELAVEDTLQGFTDSFVDATGVKLIDFSVLFGQESRSGAPEDVTGTVAIYGLGNISATFADFSFLGLGISFFRPYIRGFFVFLLLLYNLNQLLIFIGAGGLNPSAEGRKEVKSD